MKNAIVSNTRARFIKPAIVALFLAGSLTLSPAHATDKPKDVPVEVKYIGSVQGKPQFQIAFSNPNGEEVSLTLRDENGYAIYTDVSRDKSYLRRIQFNDLEVEKLKLTLTLRTKKDVQTRAFEITKNTRTVEDIAVVSL